MRKLPNWLDGLYDYTGGMSSPEIFRTWAGISIISAVLERKVFLNTAIGVLYPNLYIFLVAPPGVGKSVLTALSSRVVQSVGRVHLASSSITRATLIEELNDAVRTVSKGGTPQSYNALYVCSNEMGVVLPSYDMEFMNKLTDIYDNQPYSEKRRNAKHNVEIKKPTINLMVGGTPGYLGEVLPDVAWEQGFMSRVILCYAGESPRASLFNIRESDQELYGKIISDLKQIATLQGECTFTPEAAEILDQFYMSKGDATAPLHPKMQHYNTRRPAHLLKLSVVASVIEKDDLVITGENVRQALEWLTETEATVPEIFAAMRGGGDQAIMKDTWYHVYTYNRKHNKHLPAASVLAFMSQRAAADKITYILKLMENAKLLEKKQGGYWAKGEPNT